MNADHGREEYLGLVRQIEREEAGPGILIRDDEGGTELLLSQRNFASQRFRAADTIKRVHLAGEIKGKGVVEDKRLQKSDHQSGDGKIFPTWTKLREGKPNGGRQDNPGDKGRSGPVAERVLIQTDSRIEKKKREKKRQQIAVSDRHRIDRERHEHSDQNSEENKRGIDESLFREELDQFAQLNVERAIQTTTVDDMLDGNPIVFGVPEDDRPHHEKGKEDHQPERSAAELEPERRRNDEKKRKAEELSQVRVFRQSPAANEKAGADPRHDFLTVFGPPEDDGCHRPKEDAQRIDGHQNAADGKERNNISENDRPKRGPGSEHLSGQKEDPERRAGGQHHGEKTDTENGIAEYVSARCNRPCHRRTFAEVAHVEMLRYRPEPVVGFIAHQLQGRRVKNPEERQRGNDEVRRLGIIERWMGTSAHAGVKSADFAENREGGKQIWVLGKCLGHHGTPVPSPNPLQGATY